MLDSFTRNLVLYIGIIILLIIVGAFLPPFLLRSGYQQTADLIYTLYSPLCHQLAYRSFFLFGEQSVYPRALAGIKNMLSYEEVTKNQALDLNEGRAFYGNQQFGYKIALCQRDLAIYSFIFIFIMIYLLLQGKVTMLPVWLWVVVGLLPIALDGGSQLFSIINFGISWLPIRESTPFLRVITGAGFGFTTAWVLLPRLNQYILYNNKK